MILRTMAIWFVVAIPVLIMLFALAMERLEHRLRDQAAQDSGVVQQDDVEEFLQSPRPEPVSARSGKRIAAALERRRARRSPVAHSRRVGQRP